MTTLWIKTYKPHEEGGGAILIPYRKGILQTFHKWVQSKTSFHMCTFWWSCTGTWCMHTYTQMCLSSCLCIHMSSAITSAWRAIFPRKNAKILLFARQHPPIHPPIDPPARRWTAKNTQLRAGCRSSLHVLNNLRYSRKQ